MEGKNQYYGLDEIGFVGTQDKRTSAQVKKDIEETIRYIKVKKSGKRFLLSKRKTRSSGKAK